MTRVRCQSLSLAAVAALSLLAVVGCGEDEGATPKNCPDLPLYDAASVADPANLAARQAAANEGCVTMPGDASSNLPSGTGGTTGTAGTTSTGGTAGAGGSAGAPQDAGAD